MSRAGLIALVVLCACGTPTPSVDAGGGGKGGGGKAGPVKSPGGIKKGPTK